MDRHNLIELTADIVAAHIANNQVAIGDIPRLIASVHEVLEGLVVVPDEEPAQKSPAVSVRASVKPDYLVCMECGRKQKVLRRHLGTAHGMTPEEYRNDYGLPRDYPMVAPNYSEHRRAMAKAIGLGRKPGETRPAPAAKRSKAKPRQRTRKAAE